jgi:hypothetical protein
LDLTRASFETSNARFGHSLIDRMTKLNLTNEKVGMPTAEVLTLLISQNEHISAIFAFTYRHPPILQERLVLNSDEDAIIAKARLLREATRLPFWEALMLTCFGERRDCTRLLEEASFHQSPGDSLIRISRDEALAGQLAELSMAQPSGHHLSFSSRIEMDGLDVANLPLLDFHCPESTENDELVSRVCKQLFRHRVLVFSSGESYHALGLYTLRETEFRDFLTRSLLFAPIVDARYVAHQLLEGACALRLSNSHEKPDRPRLKFTVG